MTEPLPERYFHSSFLSQGCEEKKKIKDLSQCICHKLCSTNIHWTLCKAKDLCGGMLAVFLTLGLCLHLLLVVILPKFPRQLSST